MSVMNWLAVVFLNKAIKTKEFFDRKLKAKQATHITDFWFKKSITASGTALKKLR